MTGSKERRHRLDDDKQFLNLILCFEFNVELVARNRHFRIAIGRDQQHPAVLTTGERRQSHAESLSRRNRFQCLKVVARHWIGSENLEKGWIQTLSRAGWILHFFVLVLRSVRPASLFSHAMQYRGSQKLINAHQLTTSRVYSQARDQRYRRFIPKVPDFSMRSLEVRFFHEIIFGGRKISFRIAITISSAILLHMSISMINIWTGVDSLLSTLISPVAVMRTNPVLAEAPNPVSVGENAATEKENRSAASEEAAAELLPPKTSFGPEWNHLAARMRSPLSVEE